MKDTGAFLIVRSLAPDARFREFVDRISGTSSVTGVARLHEVEALEPGTSPAHTLILDCPDRQSARDAFASMPIQLLDQPAAPLVLLTSQVPEAGFDDPSIPTKANVDEFEDDAPVLMLIEGSATDQDKMDTYRNIILPMMFERGAYYTAFELGGDVEVLSGSWDEAIFAISRWPSREAARDFWLCERYQRDAIPLRLDIGRFAVALVPEHRG